MFELPTTDVKFFGKEMSNEAKGAIIELFAPWIPRIGIVSLVICFLSGGIIGYLVSFILWEVMFK